MKRPVLLWCYDHLTARSQEVRLYQDVGFDVIVSCGDTQGVLVPSDFHDEGDPWNPDWRTDLRLPADVVERIRRAPIALSGGRPIIDERDAINAHVDALVTVADPDVVFALADWFAGTIIWRANGATDLDAFHRKLDRLAPLAQRMGRRFIYAAGLKRLIPIAGPMRERAIFHPVHVDPARLPFTWLGRDSAPTVTTVISHLDSSAFFRGQVERITTALPTVRLDILGQNAPGGPRGDDPRIAGTLSRSAFYSHIASSCIFVDSADRPEHIVFPPIEAMSMGVPVLAPDDGGLATAARSAGVLEEDLAAIGVVPRERLPNVLDELVGDFDALNALAKRQADQWIGEIFSRKQALGAVEAIRRAVERRPGYWRRRIIAASRARLRRQATRRPSPAVPLCARIDLRDAMAPGRVIRPAETRAETGRLIASDGGGMIRRVVAGTDHAGALLADYIPVGQNVRIVLDFEVGQPGLFAQVTWRLSISSETTAVEVKATAPGPVSLELSPPADTEAGWADLVVSWPGTHDGAFVGMVYQSKGE